MSRFYKNTVLHRHKSFGNERKRNLQKEVLEDSTPIPKTVNYDDIDAEFKKYVEDTLSLSYEGKEIPTVALFTNQRFSEYMQTWMSVDNKKNMLMNFKIITRENNPEKGTLMGDSWNIPGNRTYLMKRVEARDRNNRRYFIDYRMRQPKSIDLVYKVSIVTNKFQLLNLFNEMVNDRFKAIDDYIRPNGHFMSMKLENISDDSEYNIDDREFYSQSFDIKVKAYIITEKDYIVEERPDMIMVSFDDETNKTFAEIEEIPCEYDDKYKHKKSNIYLSIASCDTMLKFNVDKNLIIDNVLYGDTKKSNVRNFRIKINGEKTEIGNLLGKKLNDGDEIIITSISRYKELETSEIILECRDFDEITEVSE